MAVTFTHPEYLWFLLVIPILVFVHFASLKSSKRRAIKFANFEAIERVTGGVVVSKNLFLLYIRLTIVVLFILSLSGMIYWYSGQGSNSDFVVEIDSSNSMLATDLTPNILEAAKIRANEFIDLLSNNKIGIVSFSVTPIIESELTDDFSKARGKIKNIEISKNGGTDIGSAIITGVNLLANSNKPKVIILLTDGQFNIGNPIEKGINYAKEKGIIIHTIGIGSSEGGNYIVGNITLKLDEDSLKTIATSTEGSYFTAKTDQDLREAYNKIASLTETRLKLDLKITFLVIVLLLILIEWMMLNTKYRTIP
jgi:Ca-activated chloride channel family protein